MKKEVIIENKIWIPVEKTDLLKKICRQRTGKASVAAIWMDIQKFLREEPNNKAKAISAGDSSRLREKYTSYLKSMGSVNSLKNALGSIGVSRNHFELLPEIIDLYIERFEHLLNSVKAIETVSIQNTDHAGGMRFPPDVENKISDFVNDFCSYPKCNRPTKGRAMNFSTTTLVLGRACMIYGPAKGTPRYDSSKPIDFFYTADNGIWLCLDHAELINGNEWARYSAAQLIEWRNLHQVFMNEWVLGIRKVTLLGFHLDSGGAQAASHLLNYLDKQDFLFLEPKPGTVNVFSPGVNNLRDYLDEELLGLKWPVFLARQASGMMYACAAFVSIAQKTTGLPAFEDIWLVFKKIIGNSLMVIADKYKVQIPIRLSSIIPTTG